MTAADLHRVAQHYSWESLLRRAGPEIPRALLRQIAERTAEEIPQIVDPVGAVEWHIERILALARTALAVQFLAREGEPLAMGYTADMEAVSHTWGVDERHVCLTRLPAVCCECGRYMLVGLSAPSVQG